MLGAATDVLGPSPPSQPRYVMGTPPRPMPKAYDVWSPCNCAASGTICQLWPALVDRLSPRFPRSRMSFFASPGELGVKIGRAHVLTPVTLESRMPSSA